MKFLNRGFEFNRLAKAFNRAFVMINELEVKVDQSYLSLDSDVNQELLFMAYLCRREIVDQIEQYGWQMGTPMVVPMISKGRLTLMFVYQQTIARLSVLAERVGMSDQVSGVLDKGNAYYEMDNLIPDHIKKPLFNL